MLDMSSFSVYNYVESDRFGKEDIIMRKFCYFMYWLLLFGIVGFVITTIILGVVIHPYYYFLFLMHIIIDPAAYVLACQFLQTANEYYYCEPNVAEME